MRGFFGEQKFGEKYFITQLNWSKNEKSIKLSQVDLKKLRIYLN